MSRILIVEDDPDIAMGLQEDLARHGHESEVARDGDAGLRLGRDASWDVILLDVMLPLRDGFEVCRELRRLRVQDAHHHAHGQDAGGREDPRPRVRRRRLRHQAVQSRASCGRGSRP